MRTPLALLLVLVTCAACAPDPEVTAVSEVPVSTGPESSGPSQSETTDSTTPASQPVTTDAEPDGSATTDVEVDDEAAGAPGIGDSLFPTYGNGGYDVQSYDIALSWTPDDNNIDAVTTITATATQDLSAFNLDFSGLQVAEVTVDDTEATVDRVGDEMTVTPESPIGDGDTFTTAVTYSGAPGELEFGGWIRDPNDGIIAFGQPEVSALWYPVNDHPLDKASYTVRVTAPNDFTVVSNGTLQDKVAGAATTEWTYAQPFPQVSYLTTLAIGNYEIVDGGTSASGIPIRNVFPRDRVEELTAAFANQPAMIDAFEARFGPYPFDIYGSLVLDGIFTGAALENQTLSVYSEGAEDEVIQAHELAHQWFGNSVALSDWGDLWLNEGFASYGEYIWQESQDPAFSTTDSLSQYFGQPLLDIAPTDLGTDFNDLFTASVYIRGAMTLHALRLEVGDDVFFDILRTYHERFEGGNATTAEFIAISEELSGAQLDDLFDEWLNAPTLPESFG
jgi:aminopeptidase N